jgi:hypothetical protein
VSHGFGNLDQQDCTSRAVGIDPALLNPIGEVAIVSAGPIHECGRWIPSEWSTNWTTVGAVWPAKSTFYEWHVIWTQSALLSK